jgi:uncharacterized protein
MSAVQAAALWGGLNLVLLFVLAVQVIRLRLRHQVAIGDGEVPDLVRAVRAHGNAVEYVPAVLAGLALMALAGAPVWAVHVGGALLFGGRVAHAVGLSGSSGPTPGRQIGMMATFTAVLWVAGALLLAAF